MSVVVGHPAGTAFNRALLRGLVRAGPRQLHAHAALLHEVEHWSLTTLREKLVKIGARIVRHGCYLVFQLVEVAVPRVLFAEILLR